MSTNIRPNFRSWVAEGSDPDLSDRLYRNRMRSERVVSDHPIVPLTDPNRREMVRLLTVRETPPPQERL